MNINWKLKSFNNLNPTELYEILKLRQTVFIVEQNCPYLDCDDKDYKSQHLMGFENDMLICYARLIPVGVSYEKEISIGRVVNHPKYRGKGAGKELMQKAIQECENYFGKQPIRIGAQKWLKKFYESFGFEDINAPYYEDGIPHLIMIRK
ncbi:MAG: GNAT family N-acetyltransferase [Ignavibacteria bacterium]|nr:GNAT family N-acetyltransferase [Ignavibacteria bacterium]